MAKLGFIGLGAMGGRIAARLLEAGHELTGYNRTREKAQGLIDKGMVWAGTPRQVAENTDVIFSMVTNTATVLSIVEGPEGVLAGLGPGKFYVDMSTISPAASRELAGKVAEKGAQMLDAPVSGSPLTVEQGNLSIMVGGDEEAFEKVKPILLIIGPKVTRVGGNGQAEAMKIASNLSLAVQMLAFSEGVLLAEKSGIPRKIAVDVLTNSVIASGMLKYRGPFVLNMPEEAWFDVNLMQKDMALALEMGRQLDVPLPTAAAANEMLSAARGLGMGEQDFAILFKVLAILSGVEK